MLTRSMDRPDMAGVQDVRLPFLKKAFVGEAL
jgi:hypothetical protein